MSNYKNRSNTYTFSGTLAGTLGLGPELPGSGGERPDSGDGRFSIGAANLFVAIFTISGGALSIIPGTLSVQWSSPDLAAYGSAPVTDTQYYTIPNPTGIGIVNLTGTWTVTVACEEFATPTAGATVADPTKCSIFPTDLDLTAFLTLQPGAPVTVTVTYGMSTISLTTTATSVISPFVPTTQVDVIAEGTFVPASMTANPVMGGVTVGGISGTQSDAHHSASWGSGVFASVDGAGASQSTEVSYSLTGLGVYDLQGRIQAWDSAYPDTLTVQWITGIIPATGLPRIVPMTVTGGSFSLLFTQQSYTVIVKFDGGTVYTNAYDDLGGVWGWIDPGSLSAVGEDPEIGMIGIIQQRMWMRGWKWDAVTISQATSLTAFTGTWSATGSGGSITVAASTWDAHLIGTQWSGGSLAGYAFADVYLTADAASKPARIHFDGKYWDVTVGTSGSVRIDLNNPTSATSAVDMTDSQWTYSTAPYVANTGDRFGVHNTSGIMIDTLAAGHTYTLTKLVLVQTDHSLLTFCDSFKDWKLVYPPVVIGSVTTTTYYRCARKGDTDGQQSLESTDLVWVHTDNGGGVTSDTISAVSIAAMVTGMHSGTSLPRDGWDATDLLPNPLDGLFLVFDDLINSDLPSGCVNASGIWYDGTAWQSGFDLANGTYPGQFLFNSFFAYAGAGDVFGWSGGAFGGAVKLRPAMVLRSPAWGLVATNAGRQSGITVSVTEPPSGVDGNGTTSAIGEYKTGLPFVKGGHTAKVTAAVGSIPYPNGSTAFYTRHRQRVCFGAGSTGCNSPYATPGGMMPSNHEYRVGTYHAQAIDSSGNVVYWYSDFTVPAGWHSYLVMVTEAGCNIDPVSAYDGRRILYMLWCYAPNTSTQEIHSAYSWDDGQTWTPDGSPLLTGALYPAIASSGAGRMLRAAYVDDGSGIHGNIQALYQGPGDAGYGTPYSLKDGSGTALLVTDDRFGIAFQVDQANRVLLHVNMDGDTSTSWWVSTGDDGQTFVKMGTLISGGLYPTVATSPSGEALWAAYVDDGSGLHGNIQCAYQGPGDASPGTVFTLKDETGSALLVANDRFGVAFAFDQARRVLFHLDMSTETSPSHWQSWDQGQTCVRSS